MTSSPVLVLVNPQDIVNIASAVRIACNFGIEQMRLVDPEVFDPYRIEGIAHNTADFVARVRIVPTLAEAVADCVQVAVLTGRERAAKRRTLRPREAAAELLQALLSGPVAIVAGREDSGLTNEELDLCGLVVTISTDPRHSSLNLAQAVAIMAYECWNAAGGESQPLKRPRKHADPVTSAQLEALFADWQQALWAIDFFKTRQPESVMRSFREIIHRAELDGREASLRARHGDRSRALPRADPPRMSQGRSNAYWAGNRYGDAAEEPMPTAPLKDLPPPVAERFRALRTGLLALDDVAENVRFMGTSWRWAWEYGVGNRKLCWVHFIGDQLSATFTLSEGEEDRLRRAAPAWPGRSQRPIAEGQKTGPVKWCWLDLEDQRVGRGFRATGRAQGGVARGAPPPAAITQGATQAVGW